jgi:hypothetical protein
MHKGITTGILAGLWLVGTILATTGSAEARFLPGRWNQSHGQMAAPQKPARATFNCPRCSDGQQRPATGPSQWGSGHNSQYGWGKSW